MPTVSKRPTDPAVLRAIADLSARGWTREEIMRKERISRATYYRRLAEIREREDLPDDEPD